MSLVEKDLLLHELSPPLDISLVGRLLDEYVSLESRFVLRDWEPAQLDGGQYCETLVRILYHQDSGTLNNKKGFKECIKYLQDDSVQHSFTPRHDLIHISKVLETVYKFRSQRGAIHISPTYSPNHMDVKYVVEAVRWCMTETLRIFWNGDREEAAKAIRELLQFDVPCVVVFDDAILVQRTDLSADEEILILLHFAGEFGFNRTEIGVHCQRKPPAVTKAIQRLVSPEIREVVLLGNGNFRLTDLGELRIRVELAEKLLLE